MQDLTPPVFRIAPNRAGSSAEGRLPFINTYRNAYSSTHSIRTHIKSGGDNIESGRNAVREARLNYRSMSH